MEEQLSGKEKRLANLIPGGDRKGKTGMRKKLTKNLLEWLEELVDDNQETFTEKLLELAEKKPEKYLEQMINIYKLIMPKQIQQQIQMDANVTGQAPTVNFFFGKNQKEAEASDSSIGSQQQEFLQPLQEHQKPFVLQLPEFQHSNLKDTADDD